MPKILRISGLPTDTRTCLMCAYANSASGACGGCLPGHRHWLFRGARKRGQGRNLGGLC